MPRKSHTPKPSAHGDPVGRPALLRGYASLLRSVGLAQLMLQCGLFVAADAYTSSLHTGLFSRYKREQDRNMRSGKFDEELVRMSAIADQIHRRGLILFNESFAATREQEGSEIARQAMSALLENDVNRRLRLAHVRVRALVPRQ